MIFSILLFAVAQAQPLADFIHITPMQNTFHGLQQLAETSNPGSHPTRAIVSPGFNASRDYVIGRLNAEAPGVYRVLTQLFPVTTATELEPSRLSSVDATTGVPVRIFRVGTDFSGMSYQGSGDLPSAPTQFVPNMGCSNTDWSGFTRGNVAVVSRGICDFGTKARNGAAAGAGAVLIFNNVPGNLAGTLGAVVSIPVFGTTPETGEYFRNLPSDVRAAVFSLTRVETVTVSNVIAETTSGDPLSTIVYGSHLDSVTEGPGINDNGSGSTANLELALAVSRSGLHQRTVNRIRFGWWGAEEYGLLGSAWYVNSLRQENRLGELALNINMDMLASPNYYLGVSNGSTAPPNTPADAVRGSETLTRVMATVMQNQDTRFQLTAFNGRSDYGPFIEAGIPAGNFDTGAEGIKTEEERLVFGGIAGQPYDRCYHHACDNVFNPSPVAQLALTRGAAGVLETLAMTPDLKRFLQTSKTDVSQFKPAAPVSSAEKHRIAELEQQIGMKPPAGHAPNPLNWLKKW